MRRGGFLFLAVLLASTLAIAQATTATETRYGQNTATVQGCLGSPSVGDNSFTLIQDQTRIVYTLTANTSDLKSHLGHEVTVTGPLISNASNASSGNIPSSSNPGGAVPNQTGGPASNHAVESTLQVSRVQMVSDHCAGTGTTPATALATSQDDLRATSENSPPTTTVLPLLGLLGLGSLIAGLFVRR
jgi:hypothetical protein